MATSGPNSPSAFTTANYFGGGTDWSNASNAGASDNSYATVDLAPDAFSKSLIVTNFGFAIDEGATIDGLIIEIERKSSNTFTHKDIQCFVTKNGSTSVGDDKAYTAAEWPITDTYYTYGTASDLWGTTWTPSEVNSSAFGVIFGVYDTANASTRTASVDHIRITVYYTPAAASQTPFTRSQQYQPLLAQ